MLRRCLFALAALLVSAASAHAKTWVVTGDTTNAGQRITNAILNSSDGDRIHIQSPGTYIAPSGGWVISKSLEIFGDGAGEGMNANSTLLQPANSNTPVIKIDVTGASVSQLENLYIHDLQIAQPTWPPSTTPQDSSFGILFVQSGSKFLTGLKIARVGIFGMQNDGIHLDGGSLGITGVSLEKVVSQYNVGNGLWIYYSSLVNVVDSYFSRNGKTGARILSCSAARVMWSCFEANWYRTPDGGVVAGLELGTDHGFTVLGCHFEAFDLKWTPSGLTAQSNPEALNGLYVYNTQGGQIGGCTIGNGSLTNNTRGIFIGYTMPMTAVLIQPNIFSAVDIAVEIQDDPNVTSCVVMPQGYFGQYGPGKIVVPDAVDRGHIVVPPTKNGYSLSAGIELPKLSAARRDSMSAPANGGTRREGLLIYNANRHRTQQWDGTRWLEGVTAFADSAVNLIGVTANVDTSTSTPILVSPAPGLYRVSVYSTVTTSFSGSGTPWVKIWWYGEGSKHSTQLTCTAKTVGGHAEATLPLYITGGRLLYEIGGLGSSGALSLRVRVEALQ